MHIGQRVKRREDPRLLRGQGQYVDDVRLPGTLHAVFLRSPLAHARFTVDVERARPKAVAVLTGADIELGPLAVAPTVEGMVIPPHHPLARGEVNYAGQAIAVVVAETREQAADALELIDLRLEPLPVVVDVEKALEGPLVHEELGTNLSYTWRVAGGDVDAAFAGAAHVITQRIANQRLVPMPLEGRGILARFESGELTVWASTQRPHLLKGLLAMQLRHPESLVRVISGDVGGGFGCKVNVYAEDLVVAYAARLLGRPVKWVEGRRESFLATSHGRGQVAHVELAAGPDGELLGLRCRVLNDVGAYHQFLSAAIPPLTGLMLSGPYKIPAVSVEIQGVFTNKTPTDAYRGAGKPEATFILERMVDILARRLGLDRAELRRRHFPLPEEFPFAAATHMRYDSGNYPAALDRALELIDYAGFPARKAASSKRLGLGLCAYVEIAAVGPSFMIPGGGWEMATVRIERSGFVTVLTGTAPHGQGTHTAFTQMVCDRLGVDPGMVTIRHGDTAVVSQGTGTWGSRGTTLGGSALLQALAKIIEKGQKVSARLGAAGEGLFGGMSLHDLSMAIHSAKGLEPGMEPLWEATAVFDPENFTFPSGVHAAEVELDPETGDWEVTRYVAVDDCGTIVNPLLVEGQVHGGVAQGLGQAAFEGAEYDEHGQLLHGSLVDYSLPRAEDVPRMVTATIETPSPFNPLGMKGVGEAGTIGSVPAVVNAVLDAADLEHLDMPLRPEKVWKAMQ